ncbi:uncharacterized protein LOC122498507 isoform X2 [Leptopilina heterotoma]|uniref:uncharacterized protein LOC122498507 isoform X2 n=1 Tax=Leptopilina heterotoma TaxID=63436 RepID=UPI001CA995DB|nr:uncharacterized protein LOC122498507 isoform X2 [Leptopilina heterotoma]
MKTHQNVQNKNFQFLDSFQICKSNMKYFPEEVNIPCDCEDTYLYYSYHDSCYDAYRQGPCPAGNYFVLPEGEMEAKCEKNPCNVDGLVPFNGKCHFLWKSGSPCKDENTYLGINKQFQIECNNSQYLGSMDSLKSSKSCPENTYLSPTNENNMNYSCKCKETFLFSKENVSCYKAYRQGPCSEGNYFVLPLEQSEPKCEKNPCHEDGLVPFNGSCHHVYKTGTPCSDDFHELSVTINDFQLTCTSTTKESKQNQNITSIWLPQSFFTLDLQQPRIINPPTKACPPGTRRYFYACRRTFD